MLTPRALGSRQGKLRGRPGRWTSFYDAVVPALEVRISPKGTRSWHVRLRIRGRRCRLQLGDVDAGKNHLELGAARERARAALETVAAGRDPRIATRTGDLLTVEALGAAALKGLTLRPATRDEWQRLHLVEVKALWSVAADDLDRATIRAWGAAIVKRGAPATARHAFAALRRFYSWGVSRDMIRATPFVGLESPAGPGVSNRVLTTDELRAVWRALGVMDQLAEYTGQERAYVDATRLLILTAARREMVVGMRRSELEALGDGGAARWTVPAGRMKAGRDQVVPLSLQARAIVERRLKLSRGDILFPADRHARGVMTWSSRFAADLRDLADGELRRERGLGPRRYTQRRRAGHGVSRKPKGEPIIPQWSIHNIRHTVATHMVEDLGVSSEIVSLILAHRPPGAAVTQLYQRAERLPERREALTRWAQWVDQLQSAPGQ